MHGKKALVGLLTAILLATLMTFGVPKAVNAQSYNEWKNGYSGLCLDVPYNNWYYGQKVQQYACNGGQNQLWTINQWYDGAVQICGSVYVNSTQMCIGRQQSAANGAKAVLVYAGGSDYGRWRMAGTYYYDVFHSLYDARCLDDAQLVGDGAA